MSDKYVLDGKTPVPTSDLMTWARWFETADRHVAQTHVGSMRVSTVFLGLDHSFGNGPPLLFETVIFGLSKASVTHKDDSTLEIYTGGAEYQERCSTWEEAEAMHQRAVVHARTLLN